MIEGNVDDGMIEIGDPTEEPKLAEPPPRVVIEYRERGVPWMLIPPLLILAAIGAVLLYHKFAPPTIRPQTASLAKAPAVEFVPIPISSGPLETGKPIAPTVAPTPVPAAEKPIEPATPAPVITPEPAVTLPPVVEAPAIPEKPAEPTNFPRVQGLGFDPKALEAERKGEPTADGALATTSKEAQGDPPSKELNRGAVPAEREQPTEIEPELLPPDPREAKIRQKKRVDEVKKQVEEDRTRFHTDLKAICRKWTFGEESLTQVVELFQRYGNQLEPAIKQQALFLLGKTGPYSGADRATRIEVLRAVGFPETRILDDIYMTHEKKRIGERDGPRDDSEAMYRASLFLLKHPPSQKAAPYRAISNIRPNPATGSTSSALPNGPGAR